MGMAILMRYLPIKKYYAYFIIGFVMLAYAGSLFSIMAAALVGLALAAIHYSRNKDKGAQAAEAGGMVRIDDEEVEING